LLSPDQIEHEAGLAAAEEEYELFTGHTVQDAFEHSPTSSDDEGDDTIFGDTVALPRNVVDLMLDYLEPPELPPGVCPDNLLSEVIAMQKQLDGVVESSSASVVFPQALVNSVALREADVERARDLHRLTCLFSRECDRLAEVHCANHWHSPREVTFCLDHAKESGKWSV